MRADRFEHEGEWCVTIACAARVYAVESRVVEEFVAIGLLGPCVRVDDDIALRDRDLDRLAALLRWHLHYGLDLETVAALYAPPPGS